jgi:hypothetical protein
MNRKLTCLTLGAAALLVGPRPAAACGGFFCSQTPVLQTAERVVFEIEGDVITAYVQLQYSGTDPNFAWVVPVPEVPQVEVGVGAAMFDALDAQTRPIFVSPAGVPAADASLDVSSCGGALFGGGGRAAPPSLQVRSVPLPEVDVWAKATVGPFEYVVLSAERAADLNDWLGINGYQLQPGSDPVVQGYLDRGMKLLGLKLAPDAGASQVEPIKLTYRDSAGCATIPLQLTAIAAVPNLEIITWVFGAHRVAPENFAHVTVDAAALGGERDYLPALGRAVDALGGRGFVTEKAGATADLSDSGDPRLAELLARHAYVTRLRTVIDPSEMTEDPAFTLAPELPDVSNEIVLGGGVTVTSGMMFGILLLGLAGRRRSPPRAARARFPWNAPSGFASHRSRMARYAPSSSDRSTKSRSADRMGYFSDGLLALASKQVLEHQEGHAGALRHAPPQVGGGVLPALGEGDVQAHRERRPQAAVHHPALEGAPGHPQEHLHLGALGVLGGDLPHEALHAGVVVGGELHVDVPGHEGLAVAEHPGLHLDLVGDGELRRLPVDADDHPHPHLLRDPAEIGLGAVQPGLQDGADVEALLEQGHRLLQGDVRPAVVLHVHGDGHAVGVGPLHEAPDGAEGRPLIRPHRERGGLEAHRGAHLAVGEAGVLGHRADQPGVDVLVLPHLLGPLHVFAQQVQGAQDAALGQQPPRGVQRRLELIAGHIRTGEDADERGRHEVRQHRRAP